MRVELSYGQRHFVVDVAFSERKRLSITVHPDRRITAKAPIGYQADVILRRLKRRAPWISRQLDFFEQLQPISPERQFISGETHYYLGRQYRLRIRLGETPSVRLIGRFFEMVLPDPQNNKKARDLMLDWYSLHARELLKKRVAEHLSLFTQMGAQEPKVRYRRMKKRWGSCSRNGSITLNTELVKAPIDCIDYVIVHEMCHLLCPQHDQKFYRLLRRVLPDWEKRKARLEKVVI